MYAKVDALVAADMSAEITALRSGNQAQAAAIKTRLGADSDAANAASNAYGLTVCGS